MGPQHYGSPEREEHSACFSRGATSVAGEKPLRERGAAARGCITSGRSDGLSSAGTDKDGSDRLHAVTAVTRSNAVEARGCRRSCSSVPMMSAGAKDHSEMKGGELGAVDVATSTTDRQPGQRTSRVLLSGRRRKRERLYEEQHNAPTASFFPLLEESGGGLKQNGAPAVQPHTFLRSERTEDAPWELLGGEGKSELARRHCSFWRAAAATAAPTDWQTPTDGFLMDTKKPLSAAEGVEASHKHLRCGNAYFTTAVRCHEAAGHNRSDSSWRQSGDKSRSRSS